MTCATHLLSTDGTLQTMSTAYERKLQLSAVARAITEVPEDTPMPEATALELIEQLHLGVMDRTHKRAVKHTVHYLLGEWDLKHAAPGRFLRLLEMAVTAVMAGHALVARTLLLTCRAAGDRDRLADVWGPVLDCASPSPEQADLAITPPDELSDTHASLAALARLRAWVRAEAATAARGAMDDGHELVALPSVPCVASAVNLFGDILPCTVLGGRDYEGPAQPLTPDQLAYARVVAGEALSSVLRTDPTALSLGAVVRACTCLPLVVGHHVPAPLFAAYVEAKCESKKWAAANELMQHTPWVSSLRAAHRTPLAVQAVMCHRREQIRHRESSAAFRAKSDTMVRGMSKAQAAVESGVGVGVGINGLVSAKLLSTTAMPSTWMEPVGEASARQPYGSTASTLSRKAGEAGSEAAGPATAAEAAPVPGITILDSGIAEQMRLLPEWEVRALRDTIRRAGVELAARYAAGELTCSVLLVAALLGRGSADAATAAAVLSHLWQVAPRLAAAWARDPEQSAAALHRCLPTAQSMRIRAALAACAEASEGGPARCAPLSVGWCHRVRDALARGVVASASTAAASHAGAAGTSNACAKLRVPLRPVQREIESDESAVALWLPLAVYYPGAAPDVLRHDDLGDAGHATMLPVLHIGTAADVAAACTILERGGLTAPQAATVGELSWRGLVGVDCEWRPKRWYNEMPAGAPALAEGEAAELTWPTALLQLAFHDCVVLVDMLTLMHDPATQAATVDFVCRLACDAGLLKVGFGLQGDLDRLSASYPRLQPEVPEWHHCLDLAGAEAALQGELPVAGPKPSFVLQEEPAVLPTPAMSLSTVCTRILGAGLDKTCQVSDWQSRPLSFAQSQYGAIDALVCYTLASTACQLAADRGLAQAMPVHSRVPVQSIDMSTHAWQVEPLATGAATDVAPAVLETMAAAGLPRTHWFSPGEGHSAADAAATLSVPVNRIVKTLTLLANGEPVAVCVAGGAKIDLAAVAAQLGIARRKIRFATAEQCQEIFGYQPGSVPPLGFHAPGTKVLFDTGIPADGWVFGGSGTVHGTVAMSLAQLLRAHGENAQQVRVRQLEREESAREAAGEAVAAAVAADGTEYVGDEEDDASAAGAFAGVADAAGGGDDDAAAVVDEALDEAWREKVTRALSGPHRFLVSDSLTRLARWLRVVGIDTVVSDSPATGADQAIAEQRLFVTRDRKSAARRELGPLYLVDTDDAQAQFDAVTSRFAVYCNPNDLMSRCARCNGVGYDRLTRDEVLETGTAVHSKVLAMVTEFWRCKTCLRMYWDGPVFDNTRERFQEVLQRAPTVGVLAESGSAIGKVLPAPADSAEG